MLAAAVLGSGRLPFGGVAAGKKRAALRVASERLLGVQQGDKIR
jgi:hypothetical protein